MSSISVVGLEPGPLDTDAYRSMAPRVTSIYWGGTGVFPMQVTDAEGHVTQFDYYFDRGLVRSTTDPNNLTTNWVYDDFGRVTLERRPDGTVTTWAYSACAATGCLFAHHRTNILQTELDATGAVVSGEALYLDQLDRTLWAA